jgi:glucose/arabinose dehydrogenase
MEAVKQLWSSGVRNTEKLRFRPGTNEVWGADHDSDEFGAPLRAGKKEPEHALRPADRCDAAVRVQPLRRRQILRPSICGGQPHPAPGVLRPPDILELIANTTPPAWSLGAHWAPNGWTFLSKNYFPGHQGDAFIANHGSWNASSPVGYRVERVMFDPVTQRPYGSHAVVSTLGTDGQVLDRPVDCVEAPDGTILFSTSGSRRIFRISRAGATAR